MNQSIPEKLPRRILIVDDEAAITKMLSTYLGTFNIASVEVNTGEQGVVELESEIFGCLLVDKNLPGMTGIELIARARKLQPYCPCIVITGYASKKSAIEALRLGAVDYIEKPFAALDLVVSKVEKAMENGQARLERALLQERVEALHAELGLRDAEVERQDTQIEMLSKILDTRVQMALRHATSTVGTKLQHLVDYIEKQKEKGEHNKALERVGWVLTDVLKELADPKGEALAPADPSDDGAAD